MQCLSSRAGSCWVSDHDPGGFFDPGGGKQGDSGLSSSPGCKKIMVKFTSPQAPQLEIPGAAHTFLYLLNPLEGSEITPCKDARDSSELHEISPGFPYTHICPNPSSKGSDPGEGRDHWNAWAGFLPAMKAVLTLGRDEMSLLLFLLLAVFAAF